MGAAAYIWDLQEVRLGIRDMARVQSKRLHPLPLRGETDTLLPFHAYRLNVAAEDCDVTSVAWSKNGRYAFPRFVKGTDGLHNRQRASGTSLR